MKRILYIVLMSAALLAGGTSCDVLDQYPHNAVSRDNLSSDDLELLFIGLYNYAQYKPTFNGYFQNDMGGGDFTRGGASSVASVQQWIQDCMLPTSGWSSNAWVGYYAWLYQVNEFIYAASRAEQTDSVREMLGVAYYFRGLIYYNLTSKYGNVQILRQATNDPVPNSPAADCWAFVEENLEDAIEMCPQFSSKNYVSVQAAKALMARAKLGQGKKEEAAVLAEEVIADPAFDLADFDRIFRGVSNSEEIFTYINDAEENGICFAAQFYQPATTYVPTQDVIALFTTVDKRRSISIMEDGDETVLNKYNNLTSTNPIIVSRLAEMYLISAEGKGLSGGGLERLNQLRNKRGLPNVSPKTEEEFLDAVLAERRLEFLGEGFRWFDLVRTGKLDETLGMEEKYNIFPIPQTQIDLNPNLKQNDLWK